MPQDPRTLIAQRLRNEMTAAERRLWSHLRDSQLGVRFRRQEPIGDDATGRELSSTLSWP